jgi:predicted GTPase
VYLPWRRTPLPTAVFLGKRGVGKSSTMNRLFALGLDTDPARECTTRPSAHTVQIQPAEADQPRWCIVDMPGIAANLTSASRYRRHYRRWLSDADVVVWITQANVRSYRQDQVFWRDHARFVATGARLVLGVSKFDTQLANLPGSATKPDGVDLVDRKLRDACAEIIPFTWTGADHARVVPYSVAADWNLDRLRHAIFVN